MGILLKDDYVLYDWSTLCFFSIYKVAYQNMKKFHMIDFRSMEI